MGFRKNVACQATFLYVHIGLTLLPGKLVFIGLFWKRLKNTVGEAFMPPGGEMYRFPETLGENVPRTREA